MTISYAAARWSRCGPSEQSPPGVEVHLAQRQPPAWPAPLRRREAGSGRIVPELQPIAVRLLEVVADDQLVLAGIGGRAGFQPVGERLMELGPLILGQAGIGGVADEQVAEAIGLVVGEIRAFGADEIAACQASEAARELGALVGRGAARRAPRPERPPDDGRPLEEAALSVRQAIEPGRQQGADRRRDREVAGVRSSSVRRRRRPLGQVGNELLDEQRVALGGGQIRARSGPGGAPGRADRAGSPRRFRRAPRGGSARGSGGSASPDGPPRAQGGRW